MHLTIRRKILFTALFATIGFAALQIPVAHLAGSKATFTAFDAFAPITGSFIGTIPGVIAVALMELANFILRGSAGTDVGTIIRFFPMLFGVAVFAKKTRFNLVIPLLAIAIFLAHPIGRTVWYFALFWTIPLVAHILRDRLLLARALGATFTAHAVGGALWIWAFSLPASVWQTLIPVVAIERLIFALGLCASYCLVTNLIAAIEALTNKRFGLSLTSTHLIPALRGYGEPNI